MAELCGRRVGPVRVVVTKKIPPMAIGEGAIGEGAMALSLCVSSAFLVFTWVGLGMVVTMLLCPTPTENAEEEDPDVDDPPSDGAVTRCGWMAG